MHVGAGTRLSALAVAIVAGVAACGPTRRFAIDLPQAGVASCPCGEATRHTFTTPELTKLTTAAPSDVTGLIRRAHQAARTGSRTKAVDLLQTAADTLHQRRHTEQTDSPDARLAAQIDLAIRQISRADLEARETAAAATQQLLDSLSPLSPAPQASPAPPESERRHPPTSKKLALDGEPDSD